MSRKALTESNSNEVATVSVREEPGSLLAVIAQAVTDPRVDIDKMERLLAMQERLVAEQRKTEFFAAMARIAPLLPEVDRNGRVVFDGKDGKKGQDRTYARLEDVDRAIRPIYTPEGMSLSWDTQEGPGGKIRVVGRLSHRLGHFETRQLDMPHDSSGSKNAIQAIASTVSYGRRLITVMFFNLITRDEDNDGNDIAVITEEQARDVTALIEEVHADKARFLVHMGVSAVSEILARDFLKAITALESKRRAAK